MSAVTNQATRLRSAMRTSLGDPMIINSSIILATTVLMAISGAVFWVVAARIATPSDVGIASSLVASTEALAVFAQLGLNVALIRTMPRSDRKASDSLSASAIVGLVGALLGGGYALLLPRIAPELAAAINTPVLIALFAALVAATAVNQLSDSIFLAINRVVGNLWVNGILMGVAKLALPFALVSFGAFGVYAAAGGSALIAAVASLALIFWYLPDRASIRPSSQLLSSTRFATAGYLSSVLYFVPQLIFPVLIINAQGATDSAIYFIGFQVATLLNAGVYAISNSMYAEASRAPHLASRIVRKGGRTIGLAVLAGVIAVWISAPLLLSVFGDQYADEGVTTLRILALGTFGVALNFWGAVRLRIAGHRAAMVGVQAATTTLMIVLAYFAAQHSIEAVAMAWGVGQLIGGLLGAIATATIAPILDSEALGEPDRSTPDRKSFRSR